MQRKSLKNTGPMLPGFEMLEIAEKKTLNGLTLSAEGSLVSRSAQTEKVQASLIHAGCGLNSTVSFARLNPDGCWLKTSQDCYQITLDGHLQEFSETWPPAGIMQNGEAYRQAQSALFTEEKEFFLLPTLTSNSPDSCAAGPNAQGGLYLRGAIVLLNAGELQQSGKKYQHSQLAARGGLLNPNWLDWFMGFPVGWTDIDGEL